MWWICKNVHAKSLHTPLEIQAHYLIPLWLPSFFPLHIFASMLKNDPNTHLSNFPSLISRLLQYTFYTMEKPCRKAPWPKAWSELLAKPEKWNMLRPCFPNTRLDYDEWFFQLKLRLLSNHTHVWGCCTRDQCRQISLIHHNRMIWYCKGFDSNWSHPFIKFECFSYKFFLGPVQTFVWHKFYIGLQFIVRLCLGPWDFSVSW